MDNNVEINTAVNYTYEPCDTQENDVPEDFSWIKRYLGIVD